MSEHPRADDDNAPDHGAPDDGGPPAQDQLVEQITRALRSRDPGQPEAARVAARIEAQLAQTTDRRVERPAPVAALARRGGRVVLAGALASGVAVVGAGTAAAADPYSRVARVVEGVAQAVGVDWSAMPKGYTRAQYEAFWDAGYTVEDREALEALWNTDPIETKARAGQLLLDDQPVPVAPSGASSGPGG